MAESSSLPPSKEDLIQLIKRFGAYLTIKMSNLFPQPDRLSHRHPDSLVVSLNVHILLVSCVMVASKMMDNV
ncbi:hypothetical protein ACOSP7_002616 [Xanthoceras sorbifolium]